MKRHSTEQITALVDGELRGVRRWLTRRHAAQCPVCALEYRRQRQIRVWIASHSRTVKMEDSPEFFWSKVRAEIEQHGNAPVAMPTPRLNLPDWLRQHETVLVVAATAVLLLLSVPWWLQPHSEPVVLAKVERVETPLPDTAATVLRTGDDEVAVVWLSGFPWSEDMEEMKTRLNNLKT